jgi:hypothetical protein
VHDVVPFAGVPIGHELVFGGTGVYQDHVCIATAADFERLSCPDGDHIDAAPAHALEAWQNRLKQT